jgi:hypothetical protein
VGVATCIARPAARKLTARPQRPAAQHRTCPAPNARRRAGAGSAGVGTFLRARTAAGASSLRRSMAPAGNSFGQSGSSASGKTPGFGRLARQCRRPARYSGIFPQCQTAPGS